MFIQATLPPRNVHAVCAACRSKTLPDISNVKQQAQGQQVVQQVWGQPAVVLLYDAGPPQRLLPRQS